MFYPLSKCTPNDMRHIPLCKFPPIVIVEFGGTDLAHLVPRLT